MAVRRVLPLLCLSWCLLAGPVWTQANPLSVSEYVAALDHLIATLSQPATAEQLTSTLNEIPVSWRVQGAGQTYEISSVWLLQDLNQLKKDHDRELQQKIVAHLQTLRREAQASLQSPGDVSRERALLSSILAGPEFQDVHGPTWLDRLKQRILEFLVRLLGRMFRSSTISTISDVVVYGLAAIAVFVLAYWIYRILREDRKLQRILPETGAISAKEWTVWMAEAQAASKRQNWREAVHLAYWCGISFLEGQGLWRPDQARTPREYLRLLPARSDQQPALAAITRTFELVWYGVQNATPDTFSETMSHLEKLGCRLT